MFLGVFLGRVGGERRKELVGRSLLSPAPRSSFSSRQRGDGRQQNRGMGYECAPGTHHTVPGAVDGRGLAILEEHPLLVAGGG